VLSGGDLPAGQRPTGGGKDDAVARAEAGEEAAEEFKTSVLGKTVDEAREMLGVPD
jgi:hypothetical protein